MFTFDLEALKAAHERFIKEQREEVQSALKEMGDLVLINVANDKSFNGSKLKASTTWRQTSTFKIKTSAPLKHASFINDGTSPHVIKPRRRKALRFVADGAVHFAKRVNHPGTQPTHYFDRANQKAFDEATTHLNERLEDLAKKGIL